MNNRISELAEQASRPKNISPGSMWPSYDKKFAEKFAKLIVQECIKILVTGAGNEKTVDAIWDLEELGIDVSNVLDTIKDDDYE